MRQYLEVAGAEDAADGARRGELEEVAGGRGRGGGKRRQRQLVRGRGGRRQEAIAAAAEGHVGELDVHRERVGADAPLDDVVVGRSSRQRRGVAGRRRRRERANIAVEVPRRGAARDLGRDGDGQRGGEARRRVLVVHEGVAVGRRRRGGGGGVAEHGFAFGREEKGLGLCADCGLGSPERRERAIRSGSEACLPCALLVVVQAAVR